MARRGMLDLSNLSMLIVDDNKPTRTMLSRMLRSMGVRDIFEAETAEQALADMRGALPDILLLDHRMEGMDGISLARFLRTAGDSPNPYLPIIMVSAHSEQKNVVAAREAGINEYVAKPISVTILADRLSAVIERARPFVKTEDYFGPDRRRRKNPPEDAPRRRASDREAVEVEDEDAA
ncbi:response regulator [Minwuia thermotolerans]|nr:response regulator [Minwuia thermotolerans]